MSKETIIINNKEITLTLKQKEFCQLYVSKEFFANGVQSYIEAFKVDTTKTGAYQSAKSNAYRLLTNDDLLLYINHLLELNGLNDEFVDKQLSFIITQNADFGSKLGAIKEYNKLKQRIVSKIDHTTKGETLNRPLINIDPLSLQDDEE